MSTMTLARQKSQQHSWRGASVGPEPLASQFAIEEHAISLANVREIASVARDFSTADGPVGSDPTAVVHIVNPAATRWRVIDHSRPSPDLDRCWSSAIPNVAHHRPARSPVPPNRMRWRFRVEDHCGRTVADVVIQLYWLFASTFQEGGAFVRRAWIELDDLVVDSAFDLNLRLVASVPLNVGTSRAPIACLPAAVVGTLIGLDSTADIDQRFEIWGDGSFYEVD